MLAPAFEDRYQVVQVDLPGAETSASTSSHTVHGTLETHAADLLRVMSSLSLFDVVFVGHSVGAVIGVLAAIREPNRFANMVLISPAPRFANENDYTGGFEQADIDELRLAMECDYHGWPQAMVPAMMSKNERSELVMELSNSFVRTNPEIARHFARVPFLSDRRAELPHPSVPTLILQSAHDVVAPLCVGHYINEHLSDSRMVVIETSGHCPHLSAPQETLAAITSFLHRS